MPQQIKERLLLIMQQKNKCYYCKKTYRSRHLGIDHVFPRSRLKGAPIKVLACNACNCFKSDFMPIEFIGKLETIISSLKQVLNARCNYE